MLFDCSPLEEKSIVKQDYCSQAFTWTNALFLFEPLWTDLSEIWNKMQFLLARKCIWKQSMNICVC